MLPETYAAERFPREGTPGYAAQVRLVENFTKFRWAMTELFAGKQVPQFYVHMVTLAGNILACWQNKAVPAFSHRRPGPFGGGQGDVRGPGVGAALPAGEGAGQAPAAEPVTA